MKTDRAGSARSFREVASWKYEPKSARCYAEGWQSWSVAEVVPVTQPPWRPGSEDSLIIDWPAGGAPEAGVVQASGLFALGAGDGGPVHVLGALDARHSVPRVRARFAGGICTVSADGDLSEVVDDGPGGMEGALARFGDRFAAAAGVAALRQVPPMWCSWYTYFEKVSASSVLSNLEAMDGLGIPVDIVQVDDGYEAAVGDWLVVSDHFGDLSKTFEAVLRSGRRGGIWTAPFAVGSKSALAAVHPEWLVRDACGEPVSAGHILRDQGWALDVSHPGASAYLRDVFGTMRSYGVDIFKLDFIYAGALEGRRHELLTGVEAYRLGLQLVREAVGADALLLGCGAPLLPSVGLVDAMRIGPDIASTYASDPLQRTMPCQENAARNVRARAWQHGRFWVNDPDCLLLGPLAERREEWAALVEKLGPMRSSGDDLSSLDTWGQEASRRLLRAAGTGPIVASGAVV
jgi:alpha-galactosidase